MCVWVCAYVCVCVGWEGCVGVCVCVGGEDVCVCGGWGGCVCVCVCGGGCVWGGEDVCVCVCGGGVCVCVCGVGRMCGCVYVWGGVCGGGGTVRGNKFSGKFTFYHLAPMIHTYTFYHVLHLSFLCMGPAIHTCNLFIPQTAAITQGQTQRRNKAPGREAARRV